MRMIFDFWHRISMIITRFVLLTRRGAVQIIRIQLFTGYHLHTIIQAYSFVCGSFAHNNLLTMVMQLF